MVRSIVVAGMTPEQASIAIWKFLVNRRYHYLPASDDAEMHDPVKFLNVYGYGFCDDSALNFAALCEEAGLEARVWGLNGHVVAESSYGGAWHMFDPDMACYFRGAGGRDPGRRGPGEGPLRHPRRPLHSLRIPDGGGREVLHHEGRQRGLAARGGQAGTPHRPGPSAGRRTDVRPRAGSPRSQHLRARAPLPPRAANGTLTRVVKGPAGGKSPSCRSPGLTSSWEET